MVSGTETEHTIEDVTASLIAIAPEVGPAVGRLAATSGLDRVPDLVDTFDELHRHFLS